MHSTSTLTFAPCPYGGCHRHQFMVVVFLPQQLAQILHLHTWWLYIYIYIYIYIYTTTTQCKLLERKYGICASGWKEKHHQHKLQWVKPPRVQVEYLCQLLREKRHHRKLVPVTTTVRTRCKGQGAGGVHNAAIIVTCVRVHNSNFLGQGVVFFLPPNGADTVLALE